MRKENIGMMKVTFIYILIWFQTEINLTVEVQKANKNIVRGIQGSQKAEFAEIFQSCQ